MELFESDRKRLATYSFFAILFVAAVSGLLGSGMLQSLWRGKMRFYIAFPESVIGLQKGSPVTYYGVTVGEVEDLWPIDSEQAVKVLKEGCVVLEPGETDQDGRLVPGEEWIKATRARRSARANVLVSVRVDKGAIRPNMTTTATLELMSIAGSLAVRIESSKEGGRIEKLDRDASKLVIEAKKSAFAHLKERLLGEDEGLLSRRNVENFSMLVAHLEQITSDLDTIIQSEKGHLRALVESSTRVADTLDRWTGGEPDAKIRLLLERLDRIGNRLEEWLRDDGRLATLADKTGRLADRVSLLVDDPAANGSGGASLSTLVDNTNRLVLSVDRLTPQIERLVATGEQTLAENRQGIRRLLDDLDRASRRLASLSSQLEEDPNSVIWGRGGAELDPNAK